VRTGRGEHTYEWIDNWAVIPDSPECRANGRTHGVVVTRDGSVIVFHVGNPAVLVFDPSGGLINAWGDRFPAAHGLTLVRERGTEYLWLTVLDPDDKVVCTLGENDAVCARDGFPNDPRLAEPGHFITPHSAATDAAGNIYVVEWVTGGRITKLARVRGDARL